MVVRRLVPQENGAPLQETFALDVIEREGVAEVRLAGKASSSPSEFELIQFNLVNNVPLSVLNCF